MLAVLERIAAAAAVLLLVSGLAKLRAPAPAATAVTVLVPQLRRRRLVRHAVRVGGVVEIGIGAAFLGTGSLWSAALLSGAYLVFTAAALVLVRRGDSGTSCGCFGSAPSPVGWPHVVLDAVALAAAAGTLAHPGGALGGVSTGAAAQVIVGAAQVALLAWLGYLSITALPALAAARRLEEAR